MEVKGRITQKNQGGAKQYTGGFPKSAREPEKQKLQLVRFPQTTRMKSPVYPVEGELLTPTAKRGYINVVERLRRMLSPANQHSVRDPRATTKPSTEHSKRRPEKGPLLLFLSKILTGVKTRVSTEDLALAREWANEHNFAGKDSELGKLREFFTELGSSPEITATLKRRAELLRNEIKGNKPQAENEYFRRTSDFTVKKVMQLQRVLAYDLPGQEFFLAFLIIQSDVDTSAPPLAKNRQMNREILDFFRIYISKPGRIVQNIRKLPYYLRNGAIPQENILRAKEIYQQANCTHYHPALKDLRSFLCEVFKFTAFYRPENTDKRESCWKEGLIKGLDGLFDPTDPVESAHTEISILEPSHSSYEEESRQEAPPLIMAETFTAESTQGNLLYSVQNAGDQTAGPVEGDKRPCSPFETECGAGLLLKFLEDNSRELTSDPFPENNIRNPDCLQESCEAQTAKQSQVPREQQDEGAIPLRIFKQRENCKEPKAKIANSNAKREFKDDLKRSHRKSQILQGTKIKGEKQVLTDLLKNSRSLEDIHKRNKTGKTEYSP